MNHHVTQLNACVTKIRMNECVMPQIPSLWRFTCVCTYSHKNTKKGLCTFSFFTDAQVQVHNTEPRIKCARINIIHYLGHLWFCDISMWTSPITYMNAMINVPCNKYECTNEPSSHAKECMRHKNSCEWVCHVTNMNNRFSDIFATLSLSYHRCVSMYHINKCEYAFSTYVHIHRCGYNVIQKRK